MDEIKKGDVVRLKSGGPSMTVQDVGDFVTVTDGAQCVWFEGKKRYEHVFDRATLMKEDGSGGGFAVATFR